MSESRSFAQFLTLIRAAFRSINVSGTLTDWAGNRFSGSSRKYTYIQLIKNHDTLTNVPERNFLGSSARGCKVPAYRADLGTKRPYDRISLLGRTIRLRFLTWKTKYPRDLRDVLSSDKTLHTFYKLNFAYNYHNYCISFPDFFCTKRTNVPESFVMS
jgi:hypothetical protein